MSMEKKRIFVGVDLPDSVKAFIARQYDHGNAAIRWNRRSDLHLTMGFAGELELSEVKLFADELASLSAAPFEIGLGEFVAHSGRDEPDVEWVGYRPDDTALLQLKEKVDEAIARAGIDYQFSELRPRVILGRCATKSDPSVQEFVEKVSKKVSPQIHVRSIVLFENQPESRGPRYQPIKNYRLKG